jgi:16S rRNA (guanine966-N2)-methyltransferase
VRVIAGTLGGRRLVAPKGRETRPTSDRVREALFMSLEPWAGLRVVDLFAGSGALGIEAYSRGAARVDFVERRGAALDVLRRNLKTLELDDRAHVWARSLPQGLASLRGMLQSADVVLMDPPYGGEVARQCLVVLGGARALPEGARVVVEHHAKDELPSEVGFLRRVRARPYGETVVTVYTTIPPDGGSDGT